MTIKVVKRKKINRAGNLPKRQKNTMKFESITQKQLDAGKYSKEELKRINRTRTYRVKETKQP